LVNIKRLHDDSRGFTLVELNVSLVVMSVLIISLLSAIMNFYVIMIRDSEHITMTADSQNLLRQTVEELRYGAGVRNTNTIIDANGPSGGWNTNNTNFVIIIAVPAEDSSRNYIIDSDTGQPYLNELVYYKSADSLFRRTLADPDATGNSLRTSCPPASATSSCKADTELIEHVKTMTFTLYDQDNNSTTNPLLTRSVLINLSLERDTFGNALTYDNSIRTTLRNNFN